MRIFFCGQGFVGKPLADYLESKGHEVIRYALEEPYLDNKDRGKGCDVSFICLPTPTTSQGFFDEIVRSVIPLCSKTVVIKSTLLPGTTETLQEKYPRHIILHSPEFLREKFAKEDTENPERNIVGITTPRHAEIAKEVLAILPKAKYEAVIPAKEAEMIKYAGNGFLTLKALYANLIYDICQQEDIDYEQVRLWLGRDGRIGTSHLNIKEDGRGAGGRCFVKDTEALKQLYERTGDTAGYYVLQSLVRYNIHLLSKTKKDLDILAGVYPEIEPRQKNYKKPKLGVQSKERSLFHGKPR